MHPQAVVCRIPLTKASPPPASNVNTGSEPCKPRPSPEVVGSLTMTLVAAHVRGLPVPEAVDDMLGEPGVRVEVGELLRVVAEAVEGRER